ncbi:uncharacterized protein Dwil_GK28272 [Drosophila willistoni]|uniref:Uncharacterized protein n=1 Tax=Drosophila willistoni TaxID=7260 RepID=A0A0Q9WQI1_DROWI|nr:uncharacterized protein Dwil_GK28272 [Drosophila willistoni]
MVLMESYLFCASLRLGALTKSIIIIYIIFVNGIGFMNDLIQIFETSYRTSQVIKGTIYWVEKYPQQILYFVLIYHFGHIISCMLSVYGAYKLKGIHVLPLAIFEVLYTIQVVVTAIFFLRILRHYVSLSTLIALTLVVYFYAILVVYDTLALLAFIQICHLVFSERYQQLYGTDPFNPILTTTMEDKLQEKNDKLSIPPPIIIYVMPKMGQKLWHLPQSKWWQEDSPRKESIKDSQTSKNFYQEELLSKALLRTALNEGYYNIKTNT